MSDEQVRKLFALVRDLTKATEEQGRQIERQSKQIEVLGKAVHLAVANSEIVLSGYHEQGTAIEHIRHRMERLRVRCPLMKPETNELPAVE